MVPRKPAVDLDGLVRLPAMSAADATVLTRAAKLAYERFSAGLGFSMRSRTDAARADVWITPWDQLPAEERDGWRLAVLPLVADLEEFVRLAANRYEFDGGGTAWSEACQNASEDAVLFEDA